MAEQRVHSVKAFSASHTAPPASRLGVHKTLGGDTARTADPKGPKAYPILYDVCSAIKLRAVVAARLARHWSAGGEQLWVFASLVFFVVFGFVFLIKLSLSQPMSFCIFTLLILSPIPLRGRVSERPCGA